MKPVEGGKAFTSTGATFKKWGIKDPGYTPSPNPPHTQVKRKKLPGPNNPNIA